MVTGCSLLFFCFLSKELSLDRDLCDSATLQKRAVNFSRVNNPFLVPLQAFFVKVCRKRELVVCMLKIVKS